MKTLFIITKALKPSFSMLMPGKPLNSNNFSLITASETLYATYPEAEAAIPTLGVGIFQIQKVFINEK